MRITDRVLGVIGVLIGGLFVWRATLIEEPFISDPVGPRTFPIIICVMLALAGLALILRPDPEPEWPALGPLLEVLAGAVVLAGYTVILPRLGFVIASAIASGYLCWRLGAPWMRAVIAGVAISVGIYIVFHLILGLSLARGPLGF